MVTWHVGGSVVKGGIYWSRRQGQFVAVTGREGRLGGGLEDRYYRTPTPLVLTLAPIMGLVYIVTLPLAGLWVVVPFLAGKVRRLVSSGEVTVAGFRGEPGISYLEPPGERDEPGPSEEREGTNRIIDLALEIAARRWQQR